MDKIMGILVGFLHLTIKAEVTGPIFRLWVMKGSGKIQNNLLQPHSKEVISSYPRSYAFWDFAAEKNLIYQDIHWY